MPDSSPAAPSLSLDTVLKVIAIPSRWDILRVLADGSSLMVSELSDRTGHAPDVISKQTALLRKAGVIITPRSRHLEIAPQFLSDKANRILDFGWCLVRLNTGQPG